MSSFDGKPISPSPTGNNPRRSRQFLWVLTVVVVAGLGIFIYFNRARNRALQQEMAQLRQRLDEVAGKAESAHSRAATAEQSARQAATAREQAETAKGAAEAETQKALETAEQARQQAAAAQEEKQAALAEAEGLRKRREEELVRLEEALGKIAETRRTAIGLVMNLDSRAIQFEFNKSGLSPANRELLSRIAGILITSKGYQVTVYGHTDDVGSEDYNQELSERRARAVRDYLVEAGFSPEIIATKAYGKTKPLVEGKTPEARARNRRVEIAIVDTVLNFNQTPK